MRNNQSVGFVSIVIPVYNEEATLPELLRRTKLASESLEQDYELILVDDGSRDRSAELIEQAANEEGSAVVGVILNRNYGQHNAIMAGFAKTKGDVIITLDADLQNPPEEIPKLVKEIEKGFDSVGTVRRNRKDSLLRKLPSKMVNILVKKSTGIAMTDYGCMLRAYRRHVVDAMLECNERSTFIPVLANGFSRHTSEINVDHDERADGESKYSLMSLISLTFDLVTSMTTAPLRMLSIFGGVMATLGIAFGVLLFVLRFIFGSEWAANGIFTLNAIMFVFIGAQFIGLGLLGEYIGRIYSDVRARPRYYVQEVIVGQAAQNARDSKK